MRNASAAIALLSGATLALAAPLFAQETASQPSNTSAPAEPAAGSPQQRGETPQSGNSSQAPAETPAQPAQNGTAEQGQTPASSPHS